jgi:hypothetical protein
VERGVAKWDGMVDLVSNRIKSMHAVYWGLRRKDVLE